MKKISDIFVVKYGNSLSLSKLKTDRNGINFVSRGSKNNGVVTKVKRIEGVATLPINTITVSLGGSVLESFVQDEEYYTAYHIQYLVPKTNLTKQQLFFYCMCIKANKYRYSFGRQANKTLEDILIPDVQDIPEWVHKIKIPQKPTSNSINDTSMEFDVKKWALFKYADIFDIEKGYYNKKPKKIKNGNIRFIGASKYKNGITSFHDVNDVEKVFDGNCLTVANDGNSVASAFYQPLSFTCSHSINILTLKDKEVQLDKYIALFLCAVIRLEKYRFGFGRKWRYERMNESLIKLPIDNSDQPDFEFMENYIKSLPYSASI